MTTADPLTREAAGVATPAGSGSALVDAIRTFAATHPDRTACVFVDYASGAQPSRESLTYAQLHERAGRFAGRLAQAPGEQHTVAILGAHDLDYLVSFLGCLYAGLVAVPLYAPEPYRSTQRLRSVLADCRPGIVVTGGGAHDDAAEVIASCRAEDPAWTPALVRVDAADGPAPDPVERPRADLAYLQYTSGSTRQPAGVAVTQANIAAGCRQIASAFDLGPGATMVSWLPYFHDMGLVLTVMAPLMAGAQAIYLSPAAFVRQPRRWLELISEFRATHTASPNFGLDLCTQRVAGAPAGDIDLSSLRVLVNGAEPVRAESLAAFSEKFGPWGFDDRAHTPAYGLAEATLVVTASAPGQTPRVGAFDRRELERRRVAPSADSAQLTRVVSCGAAVDQQLVIVDPRAGTVAPPDAVGEVWLRGENVCAGYWQDEALTAAVFGCELSGPPGTTPAGTWLATGDLGFLHDGELYVIGRSKDVIVVNGMNHHASDVELTVEGSVARSALGRVAVFGVEHAGAERLVVVAEAGPRSAGGDLAGLRTAIRSEIQQEHELDPLDIVFVRPGSIPKTSSGKVQRGACRELYRASALRRVGE